MGEQHQHPDQPTGKRTLTCCTATARTRVRVRVPAHQGASVPPIHAIRAGSSELLREGRPEFSTDIHRAYGNGNGRGWQRTMPGTADPWAFVEGLRIFRRKADAPSAKAMLWTSTAASSSPSLRPPVDLLYGVSAFTIEPAARIRPDRWPRKCSPGQDRHLPISTVRLIPRREPGQWGSGPQLMPVVERIGVKGPGMVIRAHPRLPPQLSLPAKAPDSSTPFRRSRISGPTVGDEAAEEIGRASTRRCTSAGTRSSARSIGSSIPGPRGCGDALRQARLGFHRRRHGFLDPAVAQAVGRFQARRDAVPIRAV